MRAWFDTITAVDPGIAHPFALGGGIAAWLRARARRPQPAPGS